MQVGSTKPERDTTELIEQALTAAMMGLEEIDAFVNAQWDTIEKWPGHCVHVEVRKGSL
jgi:hypothetical protein